MTPEIFKRLFFHLCKASVKHAKKRELKHSDPLIIEKKISELEERAKAAEMSGWIKRKLDNEMKEDGQMQGAVEKKAARKGKSPSPDRKSGV